jgi:hypothetical protein
MGQQKRYLVFLIRLWPAEEGGEPTWRASLESASSGERRAFACLEDLFAYLREQVRAQMQLPDKPGDKP